MFVFNVFRCGSVQSTFPMSFMVTLLVLEQVYKEYEYRADSKF